MEKNTFKNVRGEKRIVYGYKTEIPLLWNLTNRYNEHISKETWTTLEEEIEKLESYCKKEPYPDIFVKEFSEPLYILTKKSVFDCRTEDEMRELMKEQYNLCEKIGIEYKIPANHACDLVECIVPDRDFTDGIYYSYFVKLVGFFDYKEKKLLNIDKKFDFEHKNMNLFEFDYGILDKTTNKVIDCNEMTYQDVVEKIISNPNYTIQMINHRHELGWDCPLICLE